MIDKNRLANKRYRREKLRAEKREKLRRADRELKIRLRKEARQQAFNRAIRDAQV